MNPFVRSQLSIACVALALLTTRKVQAAVTLTLSDAIAPANAVSVSPGTTFNVSLKLVSTTAAVADQVTGVDYYLVASSSGVFSIQTRNSQTVGSSFPDTLFSDAAVAGSTINPRTTLDLGGSTTNNAVVSNGTYEVAEYAILVAAGAPAGTYTLTTGGSNAANANYSYTQGPPNFNEGTYGTPSSYTITIVPEPTSAVIVCLGFSGVLLGLFRKRHTLQNDLPGAKEF